MNHITLSGKLHSDPQVKTIPKTGRNGDYNLTVMNFFLIGDGAAVQCEAWRLLASELGQKLKKGMDVTVAGKFETSSYEKDGEKKYTSKIIANDITVGPSANEAYFKNKNAKEKEGQQAQAAPQPAPVQPSTQQTSTEPQLAGVPQNAEFPL